MVAKTVTAGLSVNASLVAGMLAVPIIRHLVGPIFMCATLADHLEDLGQHEEMARQWPQRHGKLRMLYRDLRYRWEQLHGELRLRFGGRYGTIELPKVDAIQIDDGEGAGDKPVNDFTACVVCWAEPYTHAFWPCGHRCVCRKCALRWSRAHVGGRRCVVCQQAAIDCAQVYDA